MNDKTNNPYIPTKENLPFRDIIIGKITDDDNHNTTTPPTSIQKLSETSEIDKKEIVNNGAFEDYVFARKKYKNLITQSQEILDETFNIVVEGNPRMIEVYGQLLKHSADITDKLMALHKSQKELMEIEEEQEQQHDGNTVTNNNVFVSSTDELQKIISDMRKNEKENEKKK